MTRLFWHGLIDLVAEERDQYHGPAKARVEISLQGALSLTPVKPDLPRAGDVYWLVDHETFKHLVPEANL